MSASSALATLNPTGVSAKSLLANKANALRATGAAAGGVAPGQSRGGVQFGKFDGNTGEFSFGRANIQIPPDQMFAIPVAHLTQTWTYWENKRPDNDNKRTVSAFEVLGDKPDSRPTQGTLPKPRERDGWSQAYGMQFAGVEGGAVDGIQIELERSSKGFTDMWGDVALLIADNYEKNPESDFIHPVGTFDVGSYENKNYNRTVYFLRFIHRGWTDGETIRWIEDPDDSDGAPAAVDDVLGDDPLG